jgi:hypothetical protein
MNQIFTFERGSQPIAPTLRSEIEFLWQSENVNIENVDARIAQIRYLARDEQGALAGVCSSNTQRGIFNGLLFHGMRVMVGRAHRQNLLAFDLLAHLVEDLADSRQGMKGGDPVGANVVIQTPIVAERGAIHCARTFQFPINKTPKLFMLSGFTAKGHPEYCHYFPDDSEASRLVSERWAKTSDAFCKEAAVVPQGNHVFTLESNGQTVAKCELVPRFIPEINASLLGMRTEILENTGDIDIAACFARHIHDQLNNPAQPRQDDVVGLYLLYAERTALPAVCPATRFHLHGVDSQGRELRVRFFDDLLVKVPA